MTKMTTEEAFVKVLQMHGIEHAFGIIGSAFMPISDIFPDAGITFWDVAHETNGGLIADGYYTHVVFLIVDYYICSHIYSVDLFV